MTKTTGLATAILATLFLAGPTPAKAQNLLYDYVEERAKRLEGINNYVVRIKSISFAGAAMGDDSCLAAANCLAFDVVADVPYAGRIERQMSALEVMVLTGQSLSATEMEALGGGYLLGQTEFNQATTGDADPTGGLAALGDYFSKEPEDRSPEDVQSPAGEDPWVNPFAMMGAGGMMMMDGAKGVQGAEETLERREEIAATQARMEQTMMDQLERHGIETFGGVEATRYDSTVAPASMGDIEGQEVIAERTSVWMDNDRNLMLGHRFEGRFIENGESRPFYIQATNADFRNPPGCNDLIMPYKRTMEMGGVLNDEQMAQMKGAQKQLAEFDKKLASMSESERQMVENMMAGQMESMRNMAESGNLSFTTETTEILCNPDLKALYSTPMTAPAVLQPSGEGLLVQIQVDLTTLGYEPGNTNGVLDTMTQVAISQFEAETGMAVTGEPSQAVAGALAKALGR